MAIFFDKLAVERLFRVVEGSPVVFLPVCLHQSAVLSVENVPSFSATQIMEGMAVNVT